MKPNWTVVSNIVSAESAQWVGTCWEFFDKESDAQACYIRHKTNGDCATKRPYHEATDRSHMGDTYHMFHLDENLRPQ